MQNALGPKIVLAIDGGGSKTRCVIASVLLKTNPRGFQFTWLGEGQSGPSNPRSVGFEMACNHLLQAFQQARDEAKLTVLPATACLSLAGIGRMEEKSIIEHWAYEQTIAQEISVADDIQPLWLAAKHESHNSLSPDDDSWSNSVLLIAGTGSLAMARDRDGQVLRRGGWGYLLGDEGSGYAIGIAALKSICEAHDGGILLSNFHKALLNNLNLSEPTQLIGWLYQESLPRQQIAALSPIVFDHQRTDNDAAKIIEAAASDLARLVENVAGRIGFQHNSYSLALSGGIMIHRPDFVAMLLQHLSIGSCNPHRYHVIQQPIFGALSVAAQHAYRSSQ